MDIQILKNAIKNAGGNRAVGERCGKSYQAVQKWAINGLPRTDFTGETRYADIICKMAAKNGFPVKPRDLLDATTAFRKKRAAA